MFLVNHTQHDIIRGCMWTIKSAHSHESALIAGVASVVARAHTELTHRQIRLNCLEIGEVYEISNGKKCLILPVPV